MRRNNEPKDFSDQFRLKIADYCDICIEFSLKAGYKLIRCNSFIYFTPVLRGLLFIPNWRPK